MTLQINGSTCQVPPAYESRTLLVFLREHLHLTGTKRGCGTNDCGACKVLVEGKAVNSCVLKVSRLEGKRITTIEAIAMADGTLHPIQQAFIDAGAVQCGFCTPGMVLTAKALLDRCPMPTRQEIREEISDNLCRCTGYVKIVDAIERAARAMGQELAP